MPKLELDRRTVLRGMIGGAAVGIALPPLDVFFDDNGTAYADGTALPRRFGWWFWGNGVIPTRFNPPDVGDGWTPSEQLMPLAPLVDQVSVVSGMAVNVQNTIAHGSGPAGLLSGAPLMVRGDDGTYAAPTVDQVLAAELGGETRFRSIEAAVQNTEQGLSHNGPDSMNPPEPSPTRLFERVFSEGFRAPGDEPIIDPKLTLRRSVLDAVADQSGRLRPRLGATDQQRLDEHLAGIRDLELRLARLEEDPPDLASCMRPDMPLADYPDIEGRPQLTEINAATSQILAMALACDQTRFFSVMFSRPVNNMLFLDTEDGHHNLTHDEPGDQPQVNRIVTYIVENFAFFLETLRSIPEGDGTLLDNMCVLATTDCSLGKSHSLEDYPILLAGSCCGALRTGTHYRSSSNENASKVVFSILRAMGLRPTEWGQADGRVTEGLSAIEAV